MGRACRGGVWPSSDGRVGACRVCRGGYGPVAVAEWGHVGHAGGDPPRGVWPSSGGRVGACRACRGVGCQYGIHGPVAVVGRRKI